MTRRPLLTLCAASASLALVPAALAAKPGEPVVTAVSRSASVGETIAISGRGFVPGTRKNTVVFRSPRGRSVFVRADRATRTKLTLTLPQTLEPYLLRGSDGTALPTRFRLRVLSRKLGRLAPRRLSAVVRP